jgi:hypothetical protein
VFENYLAISFFHFDQLPKMPNPTNSFFAQFILGITPVPDTDQQISDLINSQFPDLPEDNFNHLLYDLRTLRDGRFVTLDPTIPASDLVVDESLEDFQERTAKYWNPTSPFGDYTHDVDLFKINLLIDWDKVAEASGHAR